jgi:protease IV
MKSFFKYLLVLLSGFFILFFILFMIILAISDTEPIIHENSYLHINISGSIPEYIPPNPFEEISGRVSLDLKKIRDNLEKAAVDDRINGVILDIGFLQIGYAKIHELQNLIDTYKESGKKIYAFMEFGLTKSYLVASACDSIFMPESSNLFLTGIGAGVTFYKGLLNKVGIKADFVHVGKHKDAPNSYMKENMPADQRMVLDNILDQFYEDVTNTISLRRNLTKSNVIDLIENYSGFNAKDALEVGLIDSLLYENQIAELFNYYDSEPEKINGATYASIPASSLNIRNESRIGVVHITGTISGGNDVDDLVLGKLAGSNTIVNNINSAAQSSSTKAIILRIDSPGGSASAADQIWNAVMQAKEKKPVIATISDYGASGGYYIAMAADTILNDPMSLVGSIGIFAGKFSTEELYKKIGLKQELLLRGKNAAFFSTNKLWSPSERAIMQRLIQDFYKDFVSKVASSRNMTYEETDEIAQGRVWTGNQGKELGLVDLSGTFYDAVNVAKEMAGIDESESVRLSYYPKEKDFFTELYSIISLYSYGPSWFKESEHIFITKFQNRPLALVPFILEWN